MDHPKKPFERFASRVTFLAGSTRAFIIACTIVILWLLTGPIFHYSDTWQLVINTGTTIVTFLMVFLIQKTQNRDSISIQLKLNELVASSDKASNRLIYVEDLTEEELLVLEKYFARLSEMAKKDLNLSQSHTIEEAEERHKKKLPARKQMS